VTAVVGVVGGSGGVGASSFAAILAATAGSAVLVDLDVAGGGIDVLLGIEAAAGARWSGLRLAGGRLDPATLLAGLPRWGGCAVLAADVAALEAAAVEQVITSAVEARSLDCVVVDLPRHECPERSAAVAHVDLVAVLARADVAGLVAAHGVVAALGEAPIGMVMRRGALPGERAADLVGAPLLGTLPPVSRPLPELDFDRLPRGAAKVAAGVLGGLR
jgi:MinD-like ATPase involved in chromosome partitioning or flagellar assembly